MNAPTNLFRNDSHAIDVAAGQVVFREGEQGSTMYGVIDGEIAIGRHGVLIQNIGPGGVIGEMALIDHSPRSADAVARVNSRLSVIDEKRFMRLISDHPTFALVVMRMLAERLRTANDRRTAPTS